MSKENGNGNGNGKKTHPLVGTAMEMETTPLRIRRFVLVRHVDVSGVSGVGVVAEGVIFTSGRVAMQWRREPGALSVFSDIDALLSVHGHGGGTEIYWMDEVQ
ncbi:hypothetical protein D6833_09585 [Candidatus Parcubacteria bacterium]|nr:MAG: hypothetical protein D6833_09585 [Candidatus Parcubacteria bacterium]